MMRPSLARVSHIVGINGQFRIRECSCAELIEPAQPSYAIVKITYINPKDKMIETYILESVGEVQLNEVE